MRYINARLQRFLVGSFLYVGVSAAWIFGVLDRSLVSGSDVRIWTAIVAVVAVHVAFGYWIREWSALLLPVAVLPLAVLAGYPVPAFGESSPVWVNQIIFIPFETVSIAAGLALAALVRGRRSPATTLVSS